MNISEPLYLETHRTGLLKQKIKIAMDRLRNCELCPRRCGVDRIAGELGFCKTGRYARVSSFGPHFGEEDPLVGTNGSGTVFFTHCNLLCLFCQNFDISHEGMGQPCDAAGLARIMLSLQDKGCHNINFVTPSHVVPQILESLELAIDGGLRIPIVYNTGGYDRIETLALLEGVVDIYMPDFKFWDPGLALRCCQAPDYPEVVRPALKQMHRQVGDLMIDSETALAHKGLLIRHLVLPGGLADTPEIMRFIADRISRDTYVNIMPQYRPCGRAAEVEGLNARPEQVDFEQAIRAAQEAGIHRIDRWRRTFWMF